MAAPGTDDRTLSPAELAERRAAEQRAAADFMGVKHVVMLGYPDGGLEDTRQFRGDIVRAIRMYRPHTVFAHDPWRIDGFQHRDHRMVGLASRMRSTRSPATTSTFRSTPRKVWSPTRCASSGTGAPTVQRHRRRHRRDREADRCGDPPREPGGRPQCPRRRNHRRPDAQERRGERRGVPLCVWRPVQAPARPKLGILSGGGRRQFRGRRLAAGGPRGRQS